MSILRFRAAFHRLRGLFRRRALEAEMNAELQAHLDGLTDRHIAAGMSPKDARYAAQREFGGVAQVAERARDHRTLAWIDHLGRDARSALRQLRKAPGFTVVAVLSLALGIGACTAIFSLFNASVLQPLPVNEPDKLVLLGWVPGPKGGAERTGYGDAQRDTDKATGQAVRRHFTRAMFDQFSREEGGVAEMVAVAGLSRLIVRVDDQSEIASFSQIVSGNYFRVLGVSAAVGRTLVPEDDQPGAPPVVVLSDHYWRVRFGGDPAVLERTIQINGTAATIVGVTPPEFLGTMLSDGRAEITLPLALASRIHPQRREVERADFWWLRVMGRLRDGVSAEQARAHFDGMFRAMAPEGLTNGSDVPSLRVVPGGRGRTEGERVQVIRVLALLAGFASVLLLAACTNLANLQLARGEARRREIAVRLALGAGRARVVAQLLMEGLLLSLAGAALGFLFGGWGIDWLAALLPPGDRALLALQIDGTVLGFAAGAAAITAIGFGLVPALRATRVDLASEFQRGPRALGGVRSRLGRTLQIVQVALSLVLLVAGGLFVRTLQNLQAVEMGFDPERLLLFVIETDPVGYRPGHAARLHPRLAEAIAALPGVRSVTYSSTGLLGGSFSQADFSPDPAPYVTDKPDIVAVHRIGPDFFSTYAMPLLQGRTVEAGDTAQSANVAVINRALLEKYFPGGDPIGRRVRLRDREVTIVGIVGDTKQVSLRESPLPAAYVPIAQHPSSWLLFAVRTSGAPAASIAAIRRACAAVDAAVPLDGFRTQAEQIEWSLTLERVFSQIGSFFGLVALLLASVGLYGLISFSVRRRTAEIGVRMAIGAAPPEILRMILREALGPVSVGSIFGMAAAWAASRLITNLLHGVSPLDFLTYVSAAGLLFGVTVIACWLPARRAAKIDPLVALRSE